MKFLVVVLTKKIKMFWGILPSSRCRFPLINFLKAWVEGGIPCHGCATVISRKFQLTTWSRHSWSYLVCAQILKESHFKRASPPLPPSLSVVLSESATSLRPQLVYWYPREPADSNCSHIKIGQLLLNKIAAISLQASPSLLGPHSLTRV